MTVEKRGPADTAEFSVMCKKVCDFLQDEFGLDTFKEQANFGMNFANMLIVCSFDPPDTSHPAALNMAAGMYVSSVMQTMSEALVMNFNEVHNTNLGMLKMNQQEN
jgi:hypothetical protein